MKLAIPVQRPRRFRITVVSSRNILSNSLTSVTKDTWEIGFSSIEECVTCFYRKVVFIVQLANFATFFCFFEKKISCSERHLCTVSATTRRADSREGIGALDDEMCQGAKRRRAEPRTNTRHGTEVQSSPISHWPRFGFGAPPSYGLKSKVCCVVPRERPRAFFATTQLRENSTMAYSCSVLVE